MNNAPTVKERLDPNSPHYEPELARLREAAVKAYEDHQNDLKNGLGKFKPTKRRTK